MQPEQPAGEGAGPAPSLAERAAAALSVAGAWLGGLAVVGILLLTAADVVGRYFLGQPLRGADEGTGFLVVFVVMLGAAEALRRGDHIAIDLLHAKAGARARRWLELWAMLGVLAFAGLLLVAAWNTVAFSRAFGAYSSGALEVPLWMPQSAMVVGAALLALAALARLLRALGRR